MKILFAGGGTGGHLYSGIGIAEEFLESSHSRAGDATGGPPDSDSSEAMPNLGVRSGRTRSEVPKQKKEVLFVGTPYGLEKEIVPKNGYRLEFIPVKPLKGRGILDRLKSLIQIPYSLWKSFLLLRKEKPDLVFGIGGYASGPVTLMAHFMGIKTAIIDQNSIPGMTNRILGKFVDHVFVCFEKAKGFFNPKKVYLSGNPVRRSFLERIGAQHAAPVQKNSFILLILGGSQGARSINQAMVEASTLLEEGGVGDATGGPPNSANSEAMPNLGVRSGRTRSTVRIIHQTGKADYEWVKKVYEEKGVKAEVFDFVHHIHELYAKADLIVCRAGAGTITEIEMMGKAAIFVPYPFAADDHQRFNAEEVVEKGAGRIILNSELSPEKLAGEIKSLMNNPGQLNQIQENVQKLAKPHAAREILEISLK